MIKSILTFLSTDGIDNMIQIVLFVLGLIGWLIVAKMNKENSKKDKRLSVYNDVLEKFDSINNKYSMAYSSTLSNSMLEFQIAVIEKPEKVNEYLVKYMQENQKYLKDSMDLASSLFSQFSKFRLVASKKTLYLFEKYKTESLSLINQVYSSIPTMNVQDIGLLKSEYQDLSSKGLDKAKVLRELYEELEQQMKRDVGF